LKLIARNRTVDFATPAIDTARHTPGVFDALVPEPLDYMQTADAVMTENNELRRTRFQVLQLARNRVHRYQFRAVNPAEFFFLRLPDIYEPQRRARIEQGLEFHGRDFNRNVDHNGEFSSLGFNETRCGGRCV